jgi:hypothetical protein
VDQAGFNLFEDVGFFANVFDFLDLNMTPLKESDRLFIRSISFCIGALRFRVIFIVPTKKPKVRARAKACESARLLRGLVKVPSAT